MPVTASVVRSPLDRLECSTRAIREADFEGLGGPGSVKDDISNLGVKETPFVRVLSEESASSYNAVGFI
jgi:hypothetical protein